MGQDHFGQSNHCMDIPGLPRPPSTSKLMKRRGTIGPDARLGRRRYNDSSMCSGRTVVAAFILVMMSMSMLMYSTLLGSSSRLSPADFTLTTQTASVSAKGMYADEAAPAGPNGPKRDPALGGSVAAGGASAPYLAGAGEGGGDADGDGDGDGEEERGFDLQGQAGESGVTGGLVSGGRGEAIEEPREALQGEQGDDLIEELEGDGDEVEDEGGPRIVAGGAGGGGGEGEEEEEGAGLVDDLGEGDGEGEGEGGDLEMDALEVAGAGGRGRSGGAGGEDLVPKQARLKGGPNFAKPLADAAERLDSLARELEEMEQAKARRAAERKAAREKAAAAAKEKAAHPPPGPVIEEGDQHPPLTHDYEDAGEKLPVKYTKLFDELRHRQKSMLSQQRLRKAARISCGGTETIVFRTWNEVRESSTKLNRTLPLRDLWLPDLAHAVEDSGCWKDRKYKKKGCQVAMPERPDGARGPLAGSCAVVGNSGRLRNKPWHALEIDSCELVIRFNSGVTKGYEHMVGARTSYRIMNGPYVSPKSPGEITIAQMRDMAIRTWVSHIAKHAEKGDEPGGGGWPVPPHASELALAFDPEFICHAWEWVGRAALKPSSGLVGVMFALHMCKHVHIFGYSSGDYFDKEQKPHYYDWERPKPGREGAHPFQQEKAIYKLLQRAGMVTIHE